MNSDQAILVPDAISFSETHSGWATQPDDHVNGLTPIRRNARSFLIIVLVVVV